MVHSSSSQAAGRELVPRPELGKIVAFRRYEQLLFERCFRVPYLLASEVIHGRLFATPDPKSKRNLDLLRKSAGVSGRDYSGG